jgi:hypothetical protein
MAAPTSDAVVRGPQVGDLLLLPLFLPVLQLWNFDLRGENAVNFVRVFDHCVAQVLVLKNKLFVLRRLLVLDLFFQEIIYSFY